MDMVSYKLTEHEWIQKEKMRIKDKKIEEYRKMGLTNLTKMVKKRIKRRE